MHKCVFKVVHCSIVNNSKTGKQPNPHPGRLSTIQYIHTITSHVTVKNMKKSISTEMPTIFS